MTVHEDLAKIDLVRNHIENVQRSTYRLGCKLIQRGDVELGRRLIANGRCHDSVKPAHLEHWGGIKEMPAVYVAEMVCNWYARSTEFGYDFRGWITHQATARFSFNVQDAVYIQIMEFVELLLSNPFKVNVSTAS